MEFENILNFHCLEMFQILSVVAGQLSCYSTIYIMFPVLGINLNFRKAFPADGLLTIKIFTWIFSQEMFRNKMLYFARPSVFPKGWNDRFPPDDRRKKKWRIVGYKATLQRCEIYISLQPHCFLGSHFRIWHTVRA